MSRRFAATLTRNSGADSPSRVQIGAAEAAGKFSPSDTGKVFHHNNRSAATDRSDPHYC